MFEKLKKIILKLLGKDNIKVIRTRKLLQVNNEENGEEKPSFEESVTTNTIDKPKESKMLWNPSDDEKLSVIANNYCFAMSHLHNKEEIIAQLPPATQNNLDLLNRITEICGEEIKEWEPNVPDEKVEINRLQMIIEECESRICEVNSKNNKSPSSEEENEQKKYLIFATSDSGRIRLLEDCKSISPEYYKTILELLDSLKSGNVNKGNETKFRKMSSTNNLIKGLKEVKDFKIRIIFKSISSDCIYVYMAIQKDCNWNNEITNQIYNRFRMQNEEYLNLQQGLKSEKREEIIERHKGFQNAIYNQLAITKESGQDRTEK